MQKSIHTSEYAALCGELRAARNGAGLSQRALAARLKVSPSWVAKVETGERRIDFGRVQMVFGGVCGGDADARCLGGCARGGAKGENREIQVHSLTFEELVLASAEAARRRSIMRLMRRRVAPHDEFDEACIREALAVLGQDADTDLLCVYCGEKAKTWDHVHATVHETEFSGHGHRLGNLLPCCKPCNSSKRKPGLKGIFCGV